MFAKLVYDGILNKMSADNHKNISKVDESKIHVKLLNILT